MPYIFEQPTIYIQRFYTGWITNRNQLVTPIRAFGRRIIQLFDALLAGTDLEVTQTLTLKRRAGYLAYASATLAANAMNFFSWRSASLGTFPIIDTLNDIETITSGASSKTTIYTKTVQQRGSQSTFLGIGNYLYIGNPNFNIKYDGGGSGQGQTTWGIAIASGSSTQTAGAGADDGAFGVVWSSPGNVSSASNYATVSLTSSSNSYPPLTIVQSDGLNATSFGFAVSGTVTGIQVQLDELLDAVPSGSQNASIQVQLLKNGTLIGSSKFVYVNNNANATLTFGSNSDLWGASFTSSDINGANFGVKITAVLGNQNGVQTRTFSVRNVRISVFTGVQISATPTGVGSVTAVNGWSYVQCFGNSVSGHVSNASAISANTGAFSNKASVQVAVTASTDPQVNQIRVFRTTDSGGGSQFYELPNSPFPNTTGNISDTAADTALIVTSQAPINLQNSPPPAGLTAMEWWSGRMWGLVGNLLYASNGPETLLGNPNECWPPANVYTLPTTGARLVATPNGLLVACQDDTYIVRGTGIANYTVNEFSRDIAARSYNCIDSDGSNIYVLTSDRQLLQLSPNGMVDIGDAIADQIENVDPTQAYLKAHRAGRDNMLFLLDPANVLIYTYNLKQQCWNLPQKLQVAAQSCGSIEVSPGVWKFLVGFGTTIGQRDLNTFSDLGNNYSPAGVIGTIQLADPGSLAKTDGLVLDLANAGSKPTLSVLANELGVTFSNAVGSQITGAFQSISIGTNPQNDPPTLAKSSTTYRSLRYYWSLCPTSQFVKFIQFQVAWPGEAAANELLGFATFGKEFQDVPAQGQLPQLQGR